MAAETRTKRAGELAAAIEREIIDAGWPVGAVLGSESQLLERHGVSRSVLREAVRILEHRMVARMRPGPGGGLVATAPDEEIVGSVADLWLQFRGVAPRDLFETRRALELSAVGTAVERLDEGAIARLRERIAVEDRTRRDLDRAVASGEASDPLDPLDQVMQGDEFHALIAELTGNPATELFVRTLSRLTWSLYRRGLARAEPARRRPSERVHDHAQIVEAMVSGDVALARHRMQRHLEELEALVAAGGAAHEPAASAAVGAGER